MTLEMIRFLQRSASEMVANAAVLASYGIFKSFQNQHMIKIKIMLIPVQMLQIDSVPFNLAN